MLAPGRLPGLFQEPRIIAAAVANATTALTKGLSAANQKFVFMLIISSVRRTTFHKARNFFRDCWEAAPGRPFRDVRHFPLLGDGFSPIEFGLHVV
jgi:hypothetical protein